MKRWMMLLILALMGFSVYAEQKVDWKLSFPETKAHFVKVQQTWAKKEPYWNPTKEELEAKFDELDTNKDGKLSKEEWDARPKKKK